MSAERFKPGDRVEVRDVQLGWIAATITSVDDHEYVFRFDEPIHDGLTTGTGDHEWAKRGIRPRVDTRARAKLDDETIGELCDLIEMGVPKAHACTKVGVSRQALYQLMERDPEVRERIEDANDRGAEWYREQILNGGDDWKRFAWLAERLHPVTYAPPPKQVQTSGAGGGPIQTETKHSGALTVELREAVRIARSAKGEGGT